jgi:hypothetical protein
VVKQLLDIDASEGKTEQCAEAIAALLKKVGSINFKDSAPTVVEVESLMGCTEPLIKDQQLTHHGYLVTSCSLHNLPLSIANPIKQTMGEGTLGMKNVGQLIHSVHDLQESLDIEVWKVHIDEAVKFLEAYINNEYVGRTAGDECFASKWMHVKSFQQFDATIAKKDFKSTSYTIPAWVLTRWWTVGKAARVLWSAYLLLFCVT